jgi:hypothetical protein
MFACLLHCAQVKLSNFTSSSQQTHITDTFLNLSTLIKLNRIILTFFEFLNTYDSLASQFCINFANEKMQQHFNSYIFTMEQNAYKEVFVTLTGLRYYPNAI